MFHDAERVLPAPAFEHLFAPGSDARDSIVVALTRGDRLVLATAENEAARGDLLDAIADAMRSRFDRVDRYDSGVANGVPGDPSQSRLLLIDNAHAIRTRRLQRIVSTNDRANLAVVLAGAPMLRLRLSEEPLRSVFDTIRFAVTLTGEGEEPGGTSEDIAREQSRAREEAKREAQRRMLAIFDDRPPDAEVQGLDG